MSPELSFILGLVLLLAAAEGLVRSASRLAVLIGLSPLVIGLTVVAFGTSSPEIAVGLISSLDAHTDTGFGNIIGSNIFNILFVLGLSAALRPLTLKAQVVRFDGPFLVVGTLLVYLASLNGWIGRFEGIIMLAGLVAYTLIAVVYSRKEKLHIHARYRDKHPPEAESTAPKIAATLSVLALSFVVLAVSSRMVVSGAVTIASKLGIDEFFIGVTIIAIGTSLPEIATSVFAFLRDEQDIAVGNILGSCIFNLFGVLGIMSLVSGSVAVPAAAVGFDLPVAVACALIVLPLFLTGYRLSRKEGLLLLSYYAVYMAAVILSSTGRLPTIVHPALTSMVVFGIGVITVAVALGRYYIDRKSRPEIGAGNPGDTT